MKWINWGILILLVLGASIAVAETSPQSITVDCNEGQSLSATLSKLNKLTPNTVTVSGTCTEYIQVVGFENLTLRGLAGATLQQPSTGTGSVLFIGSSRSVYVDGLTFQADPVNGTGIAIGHGSTDIRLRHLNIQGGDFAITIFEHCQVSIAYVTARDPGFTALGVFDVSDVHLERSAFKSSTGRSYQVGLFVGTSHITMYDTTITNMQVGIEAYAGSVIDVLVFTNYYTNVVPNDVVINNPVGTNDNGVTITGGGSLNVGSGLVINKPGQAYGGTTGGVLISDGAAMTTGNGTLVINGSNGQGVMALNNSHATLIGATVTSTHGGLVAANLSSIDLSVGTTPTLVTGNSVDLFCDSDSTITGAANVSGVPTARCTNLLAGETASLP